MHRREQTINEGIKSTMIYGSICSGIEAATVAWHPFG
jgi:hypothetical protein